MYLKEIRTVGFKSFAEKIKIDFTKGISGVVGPNGSGKSNIVDAVRWVLGEQSVKQLRGEGAMSDVIFSGSKSRKASSSASVTLIFDNSDKYLPIDYTEVQVKRCIYRTGENEYFLNNEKCRLKDISDLFSDTGVSKESFNIISQGDIGVILSNKPEERRIIFEDAAGVIKYKKRKEEALRKLERTHDNMNRVEDIISEIKTNLGPLEKQSNDAKKYLENKKKLEEIEVSLIVNEVDEINKEYREDKNTISILNKEILKLESGNNIDSSKIEELKLSQTKLNEELYKCQQKLVTSSSLVQNLKGQKELIVERQKYSASDSKVHDNLISLKENALRKENEIFKAQNDINLYEEKNKNITGKILEINKKLEELKSEHEKSEKELIDHNRLENEIKYKIEMIKNTIENNSGVPYAVKNVLDNPKLVGIHGVVGALLETDNEYAEAISTALGASSNYVVVEDEFAAKDAINYLKINKFGRVTFLPLNIIKERYIDNETYRLLINDKEFIGVASDLIRYESSYHNIMRNLLGTTIVVPDLDVANALARKINYRYKVVTLQGEIVNVGGSLTGGTLKNSFNLITQKYQLQDNKVLLENLEKKRANLEMVINEMDAKFKEVSELKNSFVLDKTNNEIAYKYELERKNNLKLELATMQNEINNINSLLNNTLSEEEEKIINKYYEEEKNKSILESKIRTIKENLENLNDEVIRLEKESKINNSAYFKKQQELKNLEIKVNRADVKLDNLLNILTEDYAITFEKAKANYILEMDKLEARKLVDSCKLEIKKLGDVNVGAIEEYKRILERYNFLESQKEDLIKAENTILEIIKELDGIMKEKFTETFDQIKLKFKEVFKKLFGGGDAELLLTDQNNILETGIEIKALPPGKKLQHISLLSGGEKTLTAISLLFAILETRPVPFCILDEVEAALDDANVDNFGKFLNTFKNKTQFIVITHKKKTMEYADVLYGITMQESGVSKLVSVKLEEIENK